MSKELPLYQSHKRVRALKIKDIVHDVDLANSQNRDTDGSAMITPEEEGFDLEERHIDGHLPRCVVDRRYCLGFIISRLDRVSSARERG